MSGTRSIGLGTRTAEVLFAAVYCTALAVRALHRHGLLPPILAIACVWFAGLPPLYWAVIGSGMVLIGYRRDITAMLPVRTDHHRALGVSRFATRHQIEHAYRRAIQHQHPDRGGADIAAAQLNRARAELIGRRNHD